MAKGNSQENKTQENLEKTVVAWRRCTVCNACYAQDQLVCYKCYIRLKPEHSLKSNWLSDAGLKKFSSLVTESTDNPDKVPRVITKLNLNHPVNGADCLCGKKGCSFASKNCFDCDHDCDYCKKFGDPKRKCSGSEFQNCKCAGCCVHYRKIFQRKIDGQAKSEKLLSPSNPNPRNIKYEPKATPAQIKRLFSQTQKENV